MIFELLPATQENSKTRIDVFNIGSDLIITKDVYTKTIKKI